MLRDVAAAWLQKFIPIPEVHRDFLGHLDLAEQRDMDCYFGFGPRIFKSGKPHLVHCYAGEFFTFDLTAEQAQSLGIGEANMTRSFGNERQKADPTSTASITIEKMELDNQHLTTTEQIRGRCHYTMTGCYTEPWCLRLEIELHRKANVTLWFTPFAEQLQPEGTIEFTFSPVRHKGPNDEAVWQGTAVAFLRFYSMPHPSVIQGRVPISNTGGVLLDVA